MHFPLVFCMRQGPCEPKVSKEKMEDTKTTVCVSMDIALAPTRAFDVFIEELCAGFVRRVTHDEIADAVG